MKILVIGGNLYFGKRLVDLLVKNNHEVTLLNRQSKPDDFGNKVDSSHLMVEHTALTSLTTGI